MTWLETKIFVALLDEGVDVWRPVEATHEGDDRYRIVSKNQDPEDERWAFKSGDIVRCRRQAFGDGHVGLVAFEKA